MEVHHFQWSVMCFHQAGMHILLIDGWRMRLQASCVSWRWWWATRPLQDWALDLTAYHRHVADAQRFPRVVYDSGAARGEERHMVLWWCVGCSDTALVSSLLGYDERVKVKSQEGKGEVGAIWAMRDKERGDRLAKGRHFVWGLPCLGRLSGLAEGDVAWHCVGWTRRGHQARGHQAQGHQAQGTRGR